MYFSVIVVLSDLFSSPPSYKHISLIYYRSPSTKDGIVGIGCPCLDFYSLVPMLVFNIYPKQQSFLQKQSMEMNSNGLVERSNFSNHHIGHIV